MSNALGGCTCGQPDTWWCAVHDRLPGNTEAAGQIDSAPTALTGEVRPEHDSPT